jgi:hypothetical protein
MAAIPAFEIPLDGILTRTNENQAPLDQTDDILFEDSQWSTPTWSVVSGPTPAHFMAMSPRALSAVKAVSFTETFYNRIHFSPQIVDLGNLLIDTTREIEVWNAYIDDRKSLTDIIPTNPGGTSLTSGESLPTDFRALEYKIFTLSADAQGAAIIDGYYSLLFPDETVIIYVQGRRVILFPFPPNWNTPVVEVLEWKTDIIPSRSRREQRRQTRSDARRNFSFRVTVMREDSALFENILWGAQDRPLSIPVWTDKTPLIVDAAEDAALLQVDTTDLCFRANDMVVLYKSAREYEIVEAQSVLPGSITLARPLVNSWEAGTSVFPCVVGTMTTNVPAARHTSSALTSSIVFMCDPVEVDSFTPDAVAPVIYDGVEVIMRQPNWVSGVDGNFEKPFGQFDPLTGAVSYTRYADFTTFRRAYSWLLTNRAKIMDYRKMLGRRKGRLKTVYIPSWHDDFQLLENIGAGSDLLVVKDHQLSNMVGIAPSRDRIILRMKNGTILCRRLIAMTVVSNGVRLQVDQVFSSLILMSDVHAIHWLLRCRLDSDRVELQWRTNQVVVVDNQFSSVVQ